MRILVLIKQVPASNKVEVDAVTGVIKREGADSKMNPYDLYALETALKIREENGGSVTVVSMGPMQAKEVIKEAFSMGADAGVLISDRRFAGSDVLATSFALSQGVLKIGEFDLIICGKQTTDGDTAQVGAEVGELLGVPSVAGVTEISKITKEAITVSMDTARTVMRLKIKLPALICVEKGIYEPRLPSYVRKKETADREIEVLCMDDFVLNNRESYGLDGSPTQVVRIFSPEEKTARKLFCGTGEELAEKMYGVLEDLKFVRRCR